MAFDETPTYSGPSAPLDEGSDNMMNSFYVQRDVFANLPTAGNDGVTFLASDGAAGGGGAEALYRDNGATWDLIGLIPATVAPTAATYLVGAAHADLSAEIVVGPTPGGELGNTWASPTVDATHSGSPHHVQLVEASQAELEAESVVAKYVPPDLMKHSPGVSKAWATAIADGSTQFPVYNISTTTKASTGVYTVTIIDDLSDLDYSVFAQIREDAATDLTANADTFAVGSFKVTTRSGGTVADLDFAVGIWGDMA